MKNILVVEDDPAISRGLIDSLENENYKATAIADGERGYRIAANEKFDLIILDLMLPNKSGMDICRDLRKNGIGTPIIMLTSKKEEIDRIVGLELGADDYVTKPFSVRELQARIKAILRRKSEIIPDIDECCFGNFIVNFKAMEAIKYKETVELSAMEFKVLKYFCQHENIVISRSKLLDEVWGYDNYPSTRTVDNFILSLRKKIEDDPRNPKHLTTIHGAGYKFKK